MAIPDGEAQGSALSGLDLDIVSYSHLDRTDLQGFLEHIFYLLDGESARGGRTAI